MLVNSSQMWPLIRPGDDLVVRPAAAADLHAGDIVVVRVNNSLCIRRLLQKNVSSGSVLLVTKADNGFLLEQPVPLSECSGKVVSLKRGERVSDVASWPWKLAGKAMCFVSSLQALVYQCVCRCKALFCR